MALATPPQNTLKTPAPGDVVRVRTRTYLVEGVQADPHGTVVSLACMDDDAQGQALEVIWELELDAAVLGDEGWAKIGEKGFDTPRYFAAFYNTLRWHCVTATDPSLFQSPFRAGIRLDAYQLEPLRKALRLPRVNLFIADDVGLGKTIEAGLIASELLLRRRVREIVVSCPPSMLGQWRDEMEQRFGLTFEILDRAYLERVRRERGYGVNPWTTFPRFLVSHRLLIDEAYAAPLRDWLGTLRAGSLLIFDEAHHAAPSSGAKYAIDSRITRAVRDLSPRFEHRLFLSATPHNGHSNSFSALLEILDPQRFTRGVPVLKSNLDSVMVRRLKDDIRRIAGGFPERVVRQVDIDGLPEDAPELQLSRLLDAYRSVRARRVEGETRRKQAQAMLLISGLQQRLLSSVEAFAKTLAVHRRTMEKLWAGEKPPGTGARARKLDLLAAAPGSDDDRSLLSEEELEELAAAEVETATATTAGNPAAADAAAERDLLDQMRDLAEAARTAPDARVLRLLAWMQENLCPGIRIPGAPKPPAGAAWTDLRVILFTEWSDTRRYLENTLRQATGGTDRAAQRIEVFHGPTPPDKREAIKRAFNLPPAEHPVRILIATDAAREGLNLQAHCWNLFHFDVPWNPSRLEQRNGRIDRKLQPSPEVYCHYFFYAQRPEDRVLQALVRKTKTIEAELGSASKVLEHRLHEMLQLGIRREAIDALTGEIDAAELDPERRAAVEEELEAAREREDALRAQIDSLRNRVRDARKWLNFDQEHFRDALSCSLELQHAPAISPAARETAEAPPGEPPRYTFPDLAAAGTVDTTWAATLDTLRKPPEDGGRDDHWHRDAPLRPVVFEAPTGVDDDVVQLHLGHRVAQRLLSRFLAQGFVLHDLSRACLTQTRDAIPRVILAGRLALYGPGATRLHEEIIAVAARWVEPSRRDGALKPYARDGEAKSLELLDDALRPGSRSEIAAKVSADLLAALAQDVAELRPVLEERAEAAKETAEKRLHERGRIEADAMRKVLQEQKKRVERELGRADQTQLLFNLDDEKRQLQANRRHWEKWIETVDREIEDEPERILGFYNVVSWRIEPSGIAYLWPETG